MERRNNPRCDYCQGPMREDPKTNTFKCRNSLCRSHYANVACGRCGETDIELVKTADGQHSYQCPSCQHQWTEKAD